MSNKIGYNFTKTDTLIILDWDDTLFPTSWIIGNQIDLADSEIRNKYIPHFSELDEILYKLLKKLLDYGNVIIVTNALPEWVITSASIMPNTHYIVNKLKIVSARKKYKHHSSNMMDWKKMAFEDEVAGKIKSKSLLHVISIGDAEYEYNALIGLLKLSKKNKKILKSVKLMEKPSHNTLLDQLDVLFNSVHEICTSKNHMDLNFKFTSNMGNSELI